MPKKFWMVHCLEKNETAGTYSYKVYSSYQEAYAAAESFARSNPNFDFFILEAVVKIKGQVQITSSTLSSDDNFSKTMRIYDDQT